MWQRPGIFRSRTTVAETRKREKSRRGQRYIESWSELAYVSPLFVVPDHERWREKLSLIPVQLECSKALFFPSTKERDGRQRHRERERRKKRERERNTWGSSSSVMSPKVKEALLRPPLGIPSLPTTGESATQTRTLFPPRNKCSLRSKRRLYLQVQVQKQLEREIDSSEGARGTGMYRVPNADRSTWRMSRSALRRTTDRKLTTSYWGTVMKSNAICVQKMISI